MALRFLPAIALAALAVAWPTAVADGTSPDPSLPAADTSGLASASWALPGDPAAPFDPPVVPSDPTSPPDPFAVMAFSVSVANAASWLVGAEIGLAGHARCRPYSVTVPGPNTPVTEAVAVDPDGCLRDCLQRTIGWSDQAEAAGPRADDLLAANVRSLL
jgi:hypothetical protein